MVLFRLNSCFVFVEGSFGGKGKEENNTRHFFFSPKLEGRIN